MGGFFRRGNPAYRSIRQDDGDGDLNELPGNLSSRPSHTFFRSRIIRTEMEDLLKSKTQFHKLDHHSRVPITTPVGKPETIGADRLALVVAAAHYFPDQNNLVIGLGSAITYNYINRFHQFIGGSISPGMEMRFKSLEVIYCQTSPGETTLEFSPAGYDTKTNIQSGVIFGMAKEIDGVIEAYEERYENLHVLMTGGDAHYFKPFLKKKITEDPDLIFQRTLYNQ